MSTPEIFINSVSASSNRNSSRSSLEKTLLAASFKTFNQTKRVRKISQESCDTAATTEESPVEFQKDNSRNTLNILSDYDDRRSSSGSVNTNGELVGPKSGSKSKKNSLLETNKYKTEMCKKWQTIGSCPYGKKCRFAHGRDELHDKILSNKKKYKSEKCQSFYATMTCPYGSRCLFAHEERSLKDLLVTYEPTLVSSNLKRLPCFAKLKTEQSSQYIDKESLLMKTIESDLNDILSFSGN